MVENKTKKSNKMEKLFKWIHRAKKKTKISKKNRMCVWGFNINLSANQKREFRKDEKSIFFRFAKLLFVAVPKSGSKREKLESERVG